MTYPPAPWIIVRFAARQTNGTLRTLPDARRSLVVRMQSARRLRLLFAELEVEAWIAVGCGLPGAGGG